MVAHGINCFGVYIQGANAGWPNPDAGLDGFRRDGRLKPADGTSQSFLMSEVKNYQPYIRDCGPLNYMNNPNDIPSRTPTP